MPAVRKRSNSSAGAHGCTSDVRAEPVRDRARRAGRRPPEAGPFQRVQAERLERHEGSPARVARDLAEEALQLVGTEMRRDPERSEVHVERPAPDRPQAVTQVMRDRRASSRRRLEVDPEISRQTAAGEARRKPVTTAQIEQRPAGDAEQARDEPRERSLLEPAPDEVVSLPGVRTGGGLPQSHRGRTVVAVSSRGKGPRSPP